ncbi:hypothetical protein KL86PLE_60026 [uncultured Pleomorphomonas sp.]|uniref:Uncharacterized protein n=1 Tax=uncultured Pleomorphomonas sp. TaxID=442121 RepID=A0A212LJI6_9HYPH|nr:hypothetical protein KL86PLE_60026 [uncultured Pleomorphomonas sp.]
MDDVVLDDPALRPVGADQSGLVGGRRRPRRGGMRQLEAANGDVVEVMLDGVEDRAAHVDLDQLGIRVRTLEIGPDGRRVFADLGIPDGTRPVGVLDRLGGAGPAVHLLAARRRLKHGGKVRRLVEAASVEIDLAEVLGQAVCGRHEPVATDLLRERVEPAEQGVGDDGPPDVALLASPVGDALGALDHHPLAPGRLVGDAPAVAQPAARRLDPLAIFAFVNDNGVARLRQRRGAVDGAQRHAGRTVAGVRAGDGDVIDVCHRCRSSVRGYAGRSPSQRADRFAPADAFLMDRKKFPIVFVTICRLYLDYFTSQSEERYFCNSYFRKSF